jgi:dynein heavy chain
VCKELLPTPAKSHYTFNLRDVSKVFQGLLMAVPSACTTKDALARLWLHETCRVFHDRLISGEDKDYFKRMLVCVCGGGGGQREGRQGSVYQD